MASRALGSDLRNLRNIWFDKVDFIGSQGPPPDVIIDIRAEIGFQFKGRRTPLIIVIGEMLDPEDP